jgi:hypothetical protein
MKCVLLQTELYLASRKELFHVRTLPNKRNRRKMKIQGLGLKKTVNGFNG